MRNVDSYISGIVGMLSCNTAPSYIYAHSLGKKDYIDEFCKLYTLDIKETKLELVNKSDEVFFGEIFNLDKKNLDTFLYLINGIAGKSIRKYNFFSKKFEDKIYKKYTPFYFLENVYIIEFEKMAICFMIGNNE